MIAPIRAVETADPELIEFRYLPGLGYAKQRINPRCSCEEHERLCRRRDERRGMRDEVGRDELLRNMLCGVAKGLVPFNLAMSLIDKLLPVED